MNMTEYLPVYAFALGYVHITLSVIRFYARADLQDVILLRILINWILVLQSKVGIMVAGCYGMPQFRARCFLWGANSEEVSLDFSLYFTPIQNRTSLIYGFVLEK